MKKNYRAKCKILDVNAHLVRVFFMCKTFLCIETMIFSYKACWGWLNKPRRDNGFRNNYLRPAKLAIGSVLVSDLASLKRSTQLSFLELRLFGCCSTVVQFNWSTNWLIFGQKNYKNNLANAIDHSFWLKISEKERPGKLPKWFMLAVRRDRPPYMECHNNITARFAIPVDLLRK